MIEGTLPGAGPAPIRARPSAMGHTAAIAGRLARGTPAFFLDYDGTLVPIVEDPADAVLDPSTRQVVERLTTLGPVAVVSGRDLEEIRRMVDIDGMYYAGSHGFDVMEPDGTRHQRATAHRPALQRVAKGLRETVGDIDGAWMEEKELAITLHFRSVEDADAVRRLGSVLDELLADEPGLRRTEGKKIFEVRPSVRWDKGRAVSWILETLVPPGRHVPLYIGDDITDEDGFRAVADEGIGVAVSGEVARSTWAGFSLDGPDEVRTFLDELYRALVSTSP